jgi:hypothetical protein
LSLTWDEPQHHKNSGIARAHEVQQDSNKAAQMHKKEHETLQRRSIVEDVDKEEVRINVRHIVCGVVAIR